MSNSVNSIDVNEQLWLEFEDAQDQSNDEQQKQMAQIARILTQTSNLLTTLPSNSSDNAPAATTPSTPQGTTPKGHQFEITVAAFDLMYALINFSGAANNAQASEANNVSQNASLENNIAMQGSDSIDTYFNNNIEPLLAEGSNITQAQQADLQGYNTEIGLAQSENEQATKSIDPIVSRGQDMISQDVQNLNTIIDEAKTVSTGFSATIQAVQALR